MLNATSKLKLSIIATQTSIGSKATINLKPNQVRPHQLCIECSSNPSFYIALFNALPLSEGRVDELAKTHSLSNDNLFNATMKELLVKTSSVRFLLQWIKLWAARLTVNLTFASLVSFRTVGKRFVSEDSHFASCSCNGNDGQYLVKQYNFNNH